ncbi:unnamed protein product [Prunus brigantina]
MQQIRQLSGATAAPLHDGEEEQLWQSELAAARLCRSRYHVATVLQFQQLSTAAALRPQQLKMTVKH